MILVNDDDVHDGDDWWLMIMIDGWLQLMIDGWWQLMIDDW